jgi:hypothetical protein
MKSVFPPYTQGAFFLVSMCAYQSFLCYNFLFFVHASSNKNCTGDSYPFSNVPETPNLVSLLVWNTRISPVSETIDGG